uniref:tRNA-2-methylthio-N(6)-dimethylallyladenosine synthase n=1 Tax=candidate division CPR3 bacterium TaxID=2268181 RepID=A0A7C5YZ33_UNCC3
MTRESELKTYYIKTFGCPMNISDSENIERVLLHAGWKKAKYMHNAKLIVINTCSVRKKSEDKVFGLAETIKSIKRKSTKKKYPIVIVTGCMVKREVRGPKLLKESLIKAERETLKKLSKWADYSLDIEQAKKLISKIAGQQKNKVYVNPQKITALVPISFGCDNFCTYCVVPYTRGPLINRKYSEIMHDVKEAIKNGKKEIILLGQNVNSWKGKTGTKDLDFSDLLQKIDKLKGNFWVRFTSSHPKDISERLIETIAKSRHITPWIHIALQSGSNRVLRKMNRNYTAEQFIEKVRLIRKKVPHASITTDIIVGFPEESEKDFRETLKVFKICKFDMAYIAKYSPRPGTVAGELMKDNIPEEIKSERLKELTKLLKETNRKRNMLLIGKTVMVLTDKHVRRKGKIYTIGKTSTNKDIELVGFIQTGKFVKAKVTGSSIFSLKGKIIKMVKGGKEESQD